MQSRLLAEIVRKHGFFTPYILENNNDLPLASTPKASLAILAYNYADFDGAGLNHMFALQLEQPHLYGILSSSTFHGNLRERTLAKLKDPPLEFISKPYDFAAIERALNNARNYSLTRRIAS